MSPKVLCSEDLGPGMVLLVGCRIFERGRLWGHSLVTGSMPQRNRGNLLCSSFSFAS
jgi:hypothetical protein